MAFVRSQISDDPHPVCQMRQNATSSPLRHPGELAWKIHATKFVTRHSNNVKDILYLKAYCMCKFILEREYAVMTDEDEDGETAQFRRPDETLAGIACSLHKDHSHIAHERTSAALRRDEGITRTLPSIVVAVQWLCLLLGLICMICGIYGLFMKYNQDSPNAYIRWLGPAYGPVLRFTAISCIALGAVLVRHGLARPDQSSFSVAQPILRSPQGNRAHASGWKWKGKRQHER